ncbi:Flp pilus assembly complex ATPase component TadA [Vibrio tubiashii]|uniref:ATPase, T2SS/T4P/T4SS family n=1 Tax=Vibrio tubiashii TaxID=29498 RepID=UPI001EFE4BB9|nr:ATPase, T2SS/T4P/T4SS family [Vibrio tubiashii]MCG9579872.1 Flp pilus assembly complex ATPase component TadA [Vibrio tubiashii]
MNNINQRSTTDDLCVIQSISDSTLDQILQQAVAVNARDIYFLSNDYIRVRVDNRRLIFSSEPLSHSQVKELLEKKFNSLNRVYDGRSTNPPYLLINRENRKLNQNFRFSISKSTAGETEGFNCAIRPLPLVPKTYSELGLSEKLTRKVSELRKGFVLVVGATGDGKTSTIAAFKRYALENVPNKRILEFARPVENLWHNVNKHPTNQIVPHNVSENGVGGDMVSYEEAVSTAMRQAGDWIDVGEMTDQESFEKAIEFSLTGHLVTSTTHATTCDAAYSRIYFKSDSATRDGLVASLISEVEVLIAQTLLDRKGGGLVALREVLVQDFSVKQRLLNALSSGNNPINSLRLEVQKCLWEQENSFFQNAKKLHTQGHIDEIELERVRETYGVYQ